MEEPVQREDVHASIIQAFDLNNPIEDRVEDRVSQTLDILISEYQRRLSEELGLEAQAKFDERNAYVGNFENLDPSFLDFGFALAEVYAEFSQARVEHDCSSVLEIQSEVARNIFFIYSNIFAPFGALISIADPGYLKQRANAITDQTVQQIQEWMDSETNANTLKAYLLLFCDSGEHFDISQSKCEEITRKLNNDDPPGTKQLIEELVNFCIALFYNKTYEHEHSIDALKEKIKTKVKDASTQNIYRPFPKLVTDCSAKRKTIEELTQIFHNLNQWITVSQPPQSEAGSNLDLEKDKQSKCILFCGINALNLLANEIGNAYNNMPEFIPLRQAIAQAILHHSRRILPDSIIRAYELLISNAQHGTDEPKRQENWLSRHSFKLSVAIFIVLLLVGLILDLTMVGAWLGIILHGIDAFVLAAGMGISCYTIFNFSKVTQFASKHPYLVVSALVVAGLFTFGFAWKVFAGASVVVWLGAHVPKFGYLFIKIANVVSALSTKSFTLPPLFEGASLSVISMGIMTACRGAYEVVKYSFQTIRTFFSQNKVVKIQEKQSTAKVEMNISTSFMLTIFGVNVNNVKNVKTHSSTSLSVTSNTVPSTDPDPSICQIISYWWKINKPTGVVHWRPQQSQGKGL